MMLDYIGEEVEREAKARREREAKEFREEEERDAKARRERKAKTRIR